MLKFFIFAAFLFGIALVSMYPSHKHGLPDRGNVTMTTTSSESAEERNDVTDETRHWPNSTVPYEFASEYPNHLKDLFHQAIHHISSQTCIKFIPRNHEPNYIKIMEGNGEDCQSQVGYLRIGPQEVWLPECCYGNCRMLGQFVHELIHTLGFVHEHTRHDRDKYVEIVWDNIIPDAIRDFEIWEEDEISFYGVEYDFGSVMHYPRNMFAIDNQSDTIITKPPGIAIGQLDGMSEKDVLKVNRMYNCSLG